MSELVLEGKYSNTKLTYLQQKLLEHCKKEHDSTLVGDKVEIYEWKDKVRNWKERTTTLPLGQHLGHYKALLAIGPFDPNSDEGKDLRAKQDQLVGIHLELLNYALVHKYSYDRWKIVVNMIMPKE
eukprot:7122845-Ditylum_brightwellii.AAC.1